MSLRIYAKEYKNILELINKKILKKLNSCGIYRCFNCNVVFKKHIGFEFHNCTKEDEIIPFNRKFTKVKIYNDIPNGDRIEIRTHKNEGSCDIFFAEKECYFYFKYSRFYEKPDTSNSIKIDSKMAGELFNSPDKLKHFLNKINILRE